MDSPLSRSPGSSVLIGVGLPMTRPSSALGGLHKLEYCCTLPHSNSPPVLVPLLPLLLLPLLLLFQWGEWPIGWDAPEPAPPILVWLVPGVACQLVVPPSNWPCAKKRFTSSSPANSARMVVFPSTHLNEDDRKNADEEDHKSQLRPLWEVQYDIYMCRDFWALAASSLELYRTTALPCVRLRWNVIRGPCCMHSVRKVDPSIWDTNIPTMGYFANGGMVKKYLKPRQSGWLCHLWSEVPQNQPATGPGGAVRTPCGTCCFEDTHKADTFSTKGTKLTENQTDHLLLLNECCQFLLCENKIQSQLTTTVEHHMKVLPCAAFANFRQLFMTLRSHKRQE